MSLLAAVLFFVYTWGLGFTLTRFVKESDSFLERNIMRLGFGLSAFILLGIILNALRIPIDYRIFIIASAAAPLYCLIFKKGYRNFPKLSLKLTASTLGILAVLLIFLFSLFMYETGAFSYPYLEDDDPWGHASAAKYVSIEKTVYDSPYLNFQYMDPYPPGYDMALGILAQASSSVYWVVKFFNALLISLSILFFYFFAKEFTASRGKALFATFVLASVPAYLSHFIWAPALAMAVFFQAMYALEMIKHDKRWVIVAAVCFASILLAHPTHAVKLSAMVAIYLGIKLLSGFVSDRKAWLQQDFHYIQAVALGAALSLFWWGLKLKSFADMARGGLRGGPEAAAEAIRSSGNIITKFITIITRALNPESGTATRIYFFRDFVVAHSTNMINNPIGFGVVASLLVFAGLAAVIFRLASANRTMSDCTFRLWRNCAVPKRKVVVPAVLALCFVVTMLPLGVSALQIVLAVILSAFILSLFAVASQKEKSLWLPITLGWLLFAFLGVNSKTFDLPIGLFAFRFWMILAVPFAIIAAEGFFALLNTISLFKLGKPAATAAKAILIAVVVAGIFFTSAKQKYDVNTAQWPPGAFWSVLTDQQGNMAAHEMQAYFWLRTLPANTRVFTFDNPDQVIAFDKFACGWCQADYEMKQRFRNLSARELYDFMKSNSYDYVILGSLDTKFYDYNSTDRLIKDVVSSGLFSVANQNQLAIIFRTV